MGEDEGGLGGDKQMLEYTPYNVSANRSQAQAPFGKVPAMITTNGSDQ